MQMTNRICNYNQMIDKYCDGRKVFSYLDIAWCGIRYGFSVNEYFRWGIYDLSGIRRNAFVTSRREKRLWAENSEEIIRTFGDKSAFMEEYQPFTKRGFIDLSRESFEAFAEFAKTKKKVFIKALWACGGFGARVFEYTNDADLGRYYAQIAPEIKKYGLIAEEMILQHPKMNLVGANSVNTIRVATYTYNNEVYILGCTLRMGGENCTDNYSAGGTCATVDIETGIVVSECYRDADHHWVRHPFTGTIVPGFVIPHWDKVIEICKEAALYRDGAIYIGWDVAILEDDVLLVEANTNHGIFQSVDRVGKYGIIQAIRKSS